MGTDDGLIFISLKEGQVRGPTLHFSADAGAVTDFLPEIDKLPHGVDVSLKDVRKFLPSKDRITWSDGLQGSGFPLGYELRGKGDGFRIWVTDGGSKNLTEAEKSELLARLLAAKTEFFP